MGVYLHQFIIEAWAITTAMAPWLLVGFVLAGVISQLLPTAFIRKHLAKRSWKSVIKAVAIGVPLPLCSCGVIPVAASLRKAGASKGAVAAFTASTPQTGVDSIAATYSLMGLPFTLGRLFADVVSGLMAGFLIDSKKFNKPEASEETAEPSCCGGCCHSEDGSQDNPAETANIGHSIMRRLKAIFEEAFVALPKEIGAYIIIGILFGAAFSTAIPENFLSSYLGNTLIVYSVVTIASIPLYVCATGSIPIAYGLIAAGLSPGAAIVFLVAGPATNTATVTTLYKLIGKGSTMIYLASLIFGAWAVGFAFDYIDLIPVGSISEMEEGASFVGNISAIILLLVISGNYLSSYIQAR